MNRDCAELEFSGLAMHLGSLEATLMMEEGESLVFNIDNSKKKKMVIERDTELLNSQEVI